MKNIRTLISYKKGYIDFEMSIRDRGTVKKIQQIFEKVPISSE